MQPEIVFRHGVCSSAIFVREVTRGEDAFRIHTVAFQRRYLDDNGNLLATDRLSVSDLSSAVLVLNRACQYSTSNSAERDRREI